MENRGKIIRKIIDERGIKHAFIYRKLKIDKKTFDRKLNTHNLLDEEVTRIGNIIHHDFSNNINGYKKPFFENEAIPFQVAEPQIITEDEFRETVLDEIKKINAKLDKLITTINN